MANVGDRLIVFAFAARPLLPGVPSRGLERVPRVSRVYHEAEAGLCQLQGPAGGPLAGMPVLRDTGRAVGRRVPDLRSQTAQAQATRRVNSSAHGGRALTHSDQA